MNVWLLLFALAGDPASCPMHAEHMKQAEQAKAAEHTAHAAHSDADARGDVAMGFSHERTKHTFRLLADGGAIEVARTRRGMATALPRSAPTCGRSPVSSPPATSRALSRFTTACPTEYRP